ncbi:exonuclease 3'-5' domain-containing protein 2 [Plodia interpunctella]|uniref:exonuclease 3'-5' domain-containing protein 2 n=1 Tax=Plodia interpunctella TaxID=58824 RepID=UPI002367F36D|nr:exonuclease 3'-5' domain-containing protein 2 [Plodia interpunctella]XP_053601596.1 exonuclease 3'-5' domain-containing protein 2 [Plodia interpunctella]
MNNYSKIKLYIASAGILLGCAGTTYLFWRYKRRLRDAADAFNYLTIKTVCSENECKEVIEELQRRCSTFRSIGFDCEWVSDHGSRRPVALVQLSSYDGYCGLFRLSKLATVPSSLKELLEDKHIYKVGVSPMDDAKYLFQDYNVALKSTLDIRHIAHLCGQHPGGLAAMAKATLQVIMDKSWRIRCSDWEADELTDRQTKYASVDAHIAIKMFVNFINMLDRSPWSFMFRNRTVVWNQLDKICWEYVDVQYKQKNNVKAKCDAKTENNQLTAKKEASLSKRYSNAIRSKPLYHNSFLQAPDGELLCSCDNKKALWYVEKALADVVVEEPLTVRLRFEPSGRSVGDVGKFYQLVKENKCVVCGATNSYIRKNVVPREYRKCFPEIMKEHSSHDVVLLCARCHRRSDALDQRARAALAQRCLAPLARSDTARYLADAQGKKIRYAARALLYQSKKHNLPETRRKELERIVLEHFNQEMITEELLQEAAEIPAFIENSSYESHGLKVVEWYLEHGGGLLRLEEIWREHFLDTMRPKHMPELWSVKHNEERLRVKLKEGRLSEEQLKSIGICASRWL